MFAPNTPIKKIILILLLMLIYSVSQAAGRVESANPTNVIGWACDPLYPENIVGINVWLDNQVFIGGGDASIERESAVAAACGSNSSAHGFNMPLADNDSLHDGKSHQMHVYMITGDGRNPELSNSPVKVQYSSIGGGWVDSASLTNVSGWACDPLYPDNVVGINVAG